MKFIVQYLVEKSVEGVFYVGDFAYGVCEKVGDCLDTGKVLLSMLESSLLPKID